MAINIRGIEFACNNYLSKTFSFEHLTCDVEKQQCIDYLKESNDYDEIYYFGDKYENGGNDYEIIKKLGNRGYKINNIEDTYNIIKGTLIK